jgi:hypothetical protein
MWLARLCFRLSDAGFVYVLNSQHYLLDFMGFIFIKRAICVDLDVQVRANIGRIHRLCTAVRPSMAVNVTPAI